MEKTMNPPRPNEGIDIEKEVCDLLDGISERYLEGKILALVARVAEEAREKALREAADIADPEMRYPSWFWGVFRNKILDLIKPALEQEEEKK